MAYPIIADHNPETPLFLYLPFQSVHGPLEAPEEYLDLYPDIEDPQRQLYLAMVTAMDDAVGQVVGALEEAGLYQDSVILFFSDNGGPVKGMASRARHSLFGEQLASEGRQVLTVGGRHQDCGFHHCSRNPPASFHLVQAHPCH